MRTTQQLSVTLPNEMAMQLRARVSSGEYASESEVVRDGLRALQARERATERWLMEIAVPAYDALAARPERARTVETVRAALALEHAATEPNH